MINRAKITAIPRLPENLRCYQSHNIVRDSRDVFIEVGTVSEAEVIEAINRPVNKIN